MEMMNIAFCVNNDYVKYICVTIKSILENNSDAKICFHVLTDKILEKNKKLLYTTIASNEKISLKIYEIDDEPLQGLKTLKWTKYAWYRILLPLYLTKVSKVLYLDADTLVVDSLDDLFNIDLTKNSIAGVLDGSAGNPEIYKRCCYPDEKLYICSGVLLINLDFWRKNNLTEKIIKWSKLNYNSIILPDQDSINHICQDSKLILPFRYGVLNDYFKREFFYQPLYLKDLRECIEKPIIIHYTDKPWYINTEKHLLQSFWEYYNKRLNKPVYKFIYFRPFFKTNAKGFYKVKTIIWRWLHPMGIKNKLTVNQVLNNISKLQYND